MEVGVLALPAELAAHAERCPHCSGQVREVQELFQRLRSFPASLDLSPVPAVVDRVLQATTAEPPAPAEPRPVRKAESQWRWVVRQVATVAAALLVAAGGLTYVGLKLNQAVHHVQPNEVVERWFAPLQDWTEALFHGTR